MNKKPSVGGQAVIEGVMMRSPKRISTAVRKQDGEIEVQNLDIKPIAKRIKILGLPIIRGAASLIEMLSIGIKTLNWSAETAFPEEAEKNKSNKFWDTIITFFAVVIAMGLFLFLPLLLATLLGFKDNPAIFNLVAGGIRMVLFLIYLVAVSFSKDIQRVFEYHGAEHKAIYCYEAGEELSVDNVRKYTTLHPRCGTSFILIVAIASIIFFALADLAFFKVAGYAPKSLGRFAYHLSLWVPMAGISYELLKFSDKASRKFKIFKLFVMPGLWLQKITTNEPDDSQLEVSIRALKESLADESEKPKTQTEESSQEKSEESDKTLEEPVTNS